MKDFLETILLFWWMAGFVIAKGFWSTVACVFAPWAWYLVVEKALQVLGLI